MQSHPRLFSNEPTQAITRPPPQLKPLSESVKPFSAAKNLEPGPQMPCAKALNLDTITT